MASSLIVRRTFVACSSRRAVSSQQFGRLRPKIVSPPALQQVNTAFATPAAHATSLPSGGSTRTLSSEAESKGFFGQLKDKFDPASDKARKEKYAAQLRKMSESKVWTLGMFAEEMDSALSGWRQYIPGMSRVKQVQEIKEMKKTIDAIKKELGGDATAETMKELTKLQRLRICVAADVDPEDLLALSDQFQGMETMHRILRYRKKKGKTIPTDEESMKAAVQMDSGAVLTKEEKREIQRIQAESMGMAPKRN